MEKNIEKFKISKIRLLIFDKTVIIYSIFYKLIFKIQINLEYVYCI